MFFLEKQEDEKKTTIKYNFFILDMKVEFDLLVLNFHDKLMEFFQD